MSTPADAQGTPPAEPVPVRVQPGPLFGGRHLRLPEIRLLALIVLLFLLRDLPWRLEEFDQAKQAFTSLEIGQTGHWWFQHLPGSSLVATKPPFVAWISAALAPVFGWDLAWRLPSLLAAFALVALLWRGGEILWPETGGLIAAGAFALNFLTPRLAMLVRTDMPLSLEITLLGLVIWSRVRGGFSWTRRTRWLVFWLMLATMMTKGPIVYAFLLPGMVVHRWISRRRGIQPVPDPFGGWWHWTLPLLPFFYWLERGCVTVPGFYDDVILREFLGRFTVAKAAVHHNQPVYFYVLQLLTRWAPWSLLLLAVRLRARGVWWKLCAEPGNLWLVCWAAGGLLCLSLVPSKRVDRIFPVVPPLCLLLVAALRGAATAEAAEAAADVAATHGVEPEAGRDHLAAAPFAPPPAPVRLSWPEAWAGATLWLGGTMALIATLGQIYQVHHRHENDLAEFGARVRETRAAGRNEIVLTSPQNGDDEAMLVYLRRPAFLDSKGAIQLNSTGQLDTIVVNAGGLAKFPLLTARFDAVHPRLSSSNGGRYVLLASVDPASATAYPANAPHGPAVTTIVPNGGSARPAAAPRH